MTSVAVKFPLLSVSCQQSAVQSDRRLKDETHGQLIHEKESNFVLLSML